MDVHRQETQILNQRQGRARVREHKLGAGVLGKQIECREMGVGGQGQGQRPLYGWWAGKYNYL